MFATDSCQILQDQFGALRLSRSWFTTEIKTKSNSQVDESIRVEIFGYQIVSNWILDFEIVQIGWIGIGLKFKLYWIRLRDLWNHI